MPALKDGYHLKVQVFLFYEAPDGARRFLVFRYGENKGGFWQPVTGSVEEGETFIEGALREAQEESGVEALEKNLIETGYTFEFEAWGNRYREQAFGLRVKNETVVLSEEHEECRWGSFDDAMKLIKWETNKEGLRRLSAVLEGSGD